MTLHVTLRIFIFYVLAFFSNYLFYVLSLFYYFDFHFFIFIHSLLNSFDPQGQYITASLVNATVQAQKTNTKISKFTSNVEFRQFYLLCVCLILFGIFLVVSFSFPLIS